ncbi:MAG: methyltransferase domain-containing protein [Acidimicrobiales bacterium]
MGVAAQRWRDELAAWVIPAEILKNAPASPWGFPVELFRAEPEHSGPDVSRDVALERLPDKGSVLDVGCGGGSAGLALAPPAGYVVGLDESQAMTTEMAAAATAAGVAHETIEARWPDGAPAAPVTDVVVCHHVAYNVADLAPFAVTLAEHARLRVVMELTARHPLVATAPLWQRFHGLDRPSGPRAELAVEVLAEAGIVATMRRWRRPARRVDHDILVTFTRRRLCLPAERDAEVDEALGPDATFSDRDMVTLFWDR